MIYSTADADRVQATWKTIDRIGLTEFGTRMFERLLADHPQLIPLFSYSAGCSSLDEVKRKKFPGLQQHATQVMRKLDTCIQHCSHVSAVSKELYDLGVRHQTYNVTEHHIHMLQDAFMDTLAEVLGDTLTDDLKESWRRVYSSITDALANGIKGGPRS